MRAPSDRPRLYGGSLTIDDGERLVVQAVDVPPPPGIAAGR
jgi:hypothetical protein